MSADYLAAWTAPRRDAEPLPVPGGLDRVCIVLRVYPPGHDYYEYAEVATDVQVRYHIPIGSLLHESPEVAQLEDTIEKVGAANDAMRRLTEADNG